MLQAIHLGVEAVAYIRSSLAEGDSLAHELAGLPLEGGEVTTWLGAWVDPAAVLRFSDGGVSAAGESTQWALIFAGAYLAGVRGRCAVFETWHRPEDPALQTYPYRYLVHGKEVYWLVTRDSGVDEIQSAFSSARNYPFVATLTDCDNEIASLQRGENVGKYILSRLAAQTRYLLIGAYDEEGFLLWSSGPSAQHRGLAGI